MRVQVPARAMPGVCTLRKPTPWFSRRIAAVPFKANMRSPKRPRESVNSAAQAARDEDYLEIAKGFIPALSSDKHKGQNGKIGVIGGCTEYTGAPFYAAMGALRCGADLAHVFCTRGAGTVIKVMHCAQDPLARSPNSPIVALLNEPIHSFVHSLWRLLDLQSGAHCAPLSLRGGRRRRRDRQ